MKRKLLSSLACALLLFSAAAIARAGGPTQTLDLTGDLPSPRPGEIIARVIPSRWDLRCLPAQYRVNDVDDPVPNPLGPDFLALADATTVFAQSFGSWNGLPTSFMQFQIIGTVRNPGLRRLDTINEITFRTPENFGAIAASFSTYLIRDTNFTPATDIDGDGDADAAAGIAVTTDVDGDGDLEFPVGLYRAGTTLDNDVGFNTKDFNPLFPDATGLRFTVRDEDVDTNTSSVDLMAVALHEFGHSLGLDHSMTNQISTAIGTSAVMFPFIDTGDPDSEFAQRLLNSDDMAYASFFYPEGSAEVGLPALQPGDIDFDVVYGFIAGEVRHGFQAAPLVGSNVFAAVEGSGAIINAGISGTVQLSRSTGPMPVLTIIPGWSNINGNYVIPVPKGVYRLGVEAVDGQPAATGSFNLTVQTGGALGQQNFTEEFFHAGVVASPGATTGDRNILTSRYVNIRNFGTTAVVGGFTAAPGGRYYAVRIPFEQAMDAFNQGRQLVSAEFHTRVFDASIVPWYAEAMLVTGITSFDGTTAELELYRPIARAEGFFGQDNDFAPLVFEDGQSVTSEAVIWLAASLLRELYLVLRIPDPPFPGISGIPPLIGITNAEPLRGLSYVSDDGGVTFNRVTNFDYRFGLVLSEPSP